MFDTTASLTRVVEDREIAARAMAKHVIKRRLVMVLSPE
jgi:hypothetical protein